MPNQRPTDDTPDPRAVEPGAGDEPAEDDDDVEGHVFLRAVEPDPGSDDDVEGHAFYRSPASRGE
jgi:hypothetical protein